MFKVSVGQTSLEPEQCSAGSQKPFEDRHVYALLSNLQEPVQQSNSLFINGSQSSDWAFIPSPQTPPQSLSIPLQIPFVQVLLMVHGSESSQIVPLGFNRSTGQLSELPVQVSCSSHTLPTARHTYPFGRFTSAGQVTADPLQTSGASQSPAAALHTLVDVANLHSDVQQGEFTFGSQSSP